MTHKFSYNTSKFNLAVCKKGYVSRPTVIYLGMQV